MAMDDLGISFAPTREQSELGPRQGGIAGIPEAIKVWSLRLPRVLGAKPIAPSPLMQGGGAAATPGGTDPYLSAVMQTLAKVINPAMAGGGSGGPVTVKDWFGTQPPSMPGYKPRIHAQPNPLSADPFSDDMLAPGKFRNLTSPVDLSRGSMRVSAPPNVVPGQQVPAGWQDDQYQQPRPTSPWQRVTEGKF